MDDNLTDLEELVLTAVLRAAEDATAIEMRRVLRERAGRRVARGSLYATLERLEDKGFLEWEVGASVPDRGGIPRRIFRVTPDGIVALRARYAMRLALWEGLDHVLG